MYTALFFVYGLLQLGLFVWLLRLWRETRGPIALMLMLPQFFLIWDNWRVAAGPLLGFGDLVRDFHTHIIYASNKLIAGKPDAVRRFNAAWFDTIAFMRTNKGETVKTAIAVLELPEEIASPTYDKLMPVFSTDGKFDDKALATLSRSFVDLELLPSEPKDIRRHITEEFLPKP